MTKLGRLRSDAACLSMAWVLASGADARAQPAKHASPPDVPAALRMAIVKHRQTAPGHDFARDATGAARALAGDARDPVSVVATGRGVRLVRSGGLDLRVETTRVGRDGASRDAGASRVVHERTEGQELVLERGDGVEERLLAGPLGVEQSFELRGRPRGAGPLVLEVAFVGLRPEARGEGDAVILRDRGGRARGEYRDLLAVDADGREVASRMEVRGAAVALVLDDAAARYPLRIDPLVWTQVSELTASPAQPSDSFGAAVALDGATAIVGASTRTVGSNVNQGAAFIFVQSGGTWTQQAELTLGDGTSADGFGLTVAIGGGTAVVGAPTRTVGSTQLQGAAYVFVQSGTTWTQQAELTASDGATQDEFGAAVAVSGSIALVGAYQHAVGGRMSQGAAYVFQQSGTTWTQLAELTSTDGAASDGFGSSVALGSGAALIGAPAHQVGTQPGEGAAYIFQQSGTAWTQQAELTAIGGTFDIGFGSSVALSGGTALVGAPLGGAQDSSTGGVTGAAYVFTESGTTWTQQAQLEVSDEVTDYAFGTSVALTGDTAVVGTEPLVNVFGVPTGRSAAYIFGRSGASWGLQAELYPAGDAGTDGFFGVAVAASGGAILIGSGSSLGSGAGWLFQPEPCDGGACPGVPDAAVSGGAGTDGGAAGDATTHAVPDATVGTGASSDAGAGHDAGSHGSGAGGSSSSGASATSGAGSSAATVASSSSASGESSGGCGMTRATPTKAWPEAVMFATIAMMSRLRRRKGRTTRAT